MTQSFVNAPTARRFVRSRSTAFVLLAMCLGVFIAQLDSSVVYLGVRTISAAPNASITQAQWMLDIYNLVYAALLMTGGVLGDIMGRRRILSFVAIEGPHRGLSSPLIVAISAIGIVSAIAFVRVERGGPTALLPFDMFGNRAFNAAIGIAGLMTFGMYAMLFLVPIYLQSIGTLSAAKTGLAMFPISLVFVAVSQLSGPLMKRVGARTMTASGPAGARRRRNCRTCRRLDCAPPHCRQFRRTAASVKRQGGSDGAPLIFGYAPVRP
jgi:hypothetical protein